ncbi:hypothetical protein MRX96_023325 [Rhipicephalus microplus]
MSPLETRRLHSNRIQTSGRRELTEKPLRPRSELPVNLRGDGPEWARCRSTCGKRTAGALSYGRARARQARVNEMKPHANDTACTDVGQVRVCERGSIGGGDGTTSRPPKTLETA